LAFSLKIFNPPEVVPALQVAGQSDALAVWEIDMERAKGEWGRERDTLTAKHGDEVQRLRDESIAGPSLGALG
jgi:hypothetical protein